MLFGSASVVGCFWILREIELAHLLHHDTILDRPRQVATLRLSVSKTDPLALGCFRSWGCVCSSRCEEPCGYHAVAAAIDWNVVHFSDRDGVVAADLPLFPTADGKIVTKEGMVKALEYYVVATGGVVRSTHGERLLGGHSFRITGSRRLASLGVELMVIMCLARWGTNIIMRYVQDAPLTALTDTYKMLSKKVGYSDELQRLATCADSLRDSLKAQQVHLDAIVSDVRSQSELIAALQRTSSPDFVRNLASDVVHRILIGDASMAPAHWRTICGWKFGHSAHNRCGDVCSLSWTQICGTCMPSERREAREQTYCADSSGEG